jgi:hypothetical protein
MTSRVGEGANIGLVERLGKRDRDDKRVQPRQPTTAFLAFYFPGSHAVAHAIERSCVAYSAIACAPGSFLPTCLLAYLLVFRA